MDQRNHKSLFKSKNLPIVGTGQNLLKYLFLKKPRGSVKINEVLTKKLEISFESEIGIL